MKKPVAYLSLIAFVILFCSCGKEKSPEPDSSNSKVKTYTEVITSPGFGNLSTTLNISYDANNRITAATSSTSEGDKFLFNYNSNDKYSMDLYNAGAIVIHEDFFLRNSFLDSTFQFNDSKDTSTEKYYYNANNQLIKKFEYEYNSGPHLSNTINYEFDASGNMIKSTDTDQNVDTYEYYPDLVYVMPSIMPVFNSAPKMNLVKTHTLTSQGHLVGSTFTTYAFDASNRISTITETVDDGTILTKTFSYF